MISKLIRFTLCFALFYSAQSAAYNEAMCILIKQEMQQNSNNKASQKYRKAARDYKNNCNKPKEIQAQPKPQIIEPEPAIITQPQPKIVEPAPVIQLTEEAVKDSINEQTLNLTDDQKQQINDQLNTNSNEIVIDAEPTTAVPEQVVTEQKNEAVIEQVKPATPEQNVQPTPEKSVPVKPAPVLTKPAPVIAPQPVAQSPSSLLLPTLILVIVVLIGAMIVVRLRRAKQSKAMAEPTIAAPPEVKSEKIATPAKPETTKEPEIEPVVINEVTQNNKPVESSVEANEEPLEPTNTTQNADIEHTPPQISDEQNNVVTQVQTSEIEPTPLNSIDTLEQTSTATFNEVKQKPEPNTAEFEAAAKTTLERIKNASSFNEPEVRDFDPDAKPVKKQRKHHTAQVTEPAPIEAEHNTVEPVISTPEPVTASEPVVDLHAPEQIADAQSTTYTTEQDFKEPEVRTFNPDAPLPGEKPMPKKQSATPEQTQTTPQVDEPVSEPKKADSHNPFANLSLDSSWDPDSTEKPKIEEKKRAPKSQALIDAEERAKNMQTK